MIVRNLAFSMVALATTLTVSSAQATTYVYDGHVNPTNSEGGFILNYIGRNSPITLAFTTAAPFAANMAYTNVSSLITSWTASGGTAESQIDSADLLARINNFNIGTDAFGNINIYSIDVTATAALLANRRWEYLFQSAPFLNGEVVSLFDLPSQRLAAGVNCTGSCGGATPTLFRRVDAISAVPEPSSWALMLVGFGLMGGAMRARKVRAKVWFG